MYLAHSREEVVGDLVVERTRQESDELAVMGVVHARLDLRVRPARSRFDKASGNKNQKRQKKSMDTKTDSPTDLHAFAVTRTK